MANELQYYGELTQTGYTVIAKIYDASGTQVGGDVNCTESGSLAIYIGDMPTLPLGEYGVRFFEGANLLGQGSVYWSSTKEMTLDTYSKLTEVHKIQGLDIDNPMTVTPSTRTSDDIVLNISGDGETTTTVART